MSSADRLDTLRSGRDHHEKYGAAVKVGSGGAADGHRERSFLDTGLDFSTEEFDPDEQAAMLAWYDDVHDVGDLDLAPFARFWIKNDPGGFKRLKRHILTLENEAGGVTLPVAAGVLMHVFTYTAIGNGKGALYEIIAARALGASKPEILETLRVAALACGPSGMNPLGAIAEGYMDEWTEHDVTGLRWPAGWAPDVAAFRSDLDPSTDELSDEEVARVVVWHERMHGEVPVHVATLARLHPRAYKTHRLRYELAFTGALPAQLVPLLELHLAANRRWPDAARRAVQMARALGCPQAPGRDHAVLGRVLRWRGGARADGRLGGRPARRHVMRTGTTCLDTGPIPRDHHEEITEPP